MKSIFILYMPGHAGNFLTRLFSLSSNTIPHLSWHKLNDAIINSKFSDSNRLEHYSFKQVKNDYVDWQRFHRDFIDFHESDKIETLNEICNRQYTHVVYSIHPAEFIEFSKKIEKKNVDLYHVELDLDQFGSWVEQSRLELKFVTRPTESVDFQNIVSEHTSNPINLTKILTSEEEFLKEYHRLCLQMNLEPNDHDALELYRDWRSVRVDRVACVPPPLPLKIFSRAPNDDFTFSLFKSWLKSISADYEAYYVWTNPPDQFEKFLNGLALSKPNVIIGIKDLLDMWMDFNWWTDSAQKGTQLLIQLAQQHPDKNFIIFTSLENLNLEIVAVPNLQVIPWGGDLLNQAKQYPNLAPVLNKNFDSNQPFISLNRNTRQHRLVLLSYLFGCGYDQHGYISYLGQCLPEYEKPDLLDILPWEFDMERHADHREKILAGYKKFYNNKSLVVDNYGIYGKTINNNIGNFDQSLRSKYQNSFVEIVSESSFAAPGYLITEKFLNSVYGCNFPIVLGGVGIVAHLREIGFDMFDDVVDHSYDSIKNPFDRIISAIDNNHRLLVDANHVKQSWAQHRPRFENNLVVAKDHMYTWYKKRTWHQSDMLVWKS